MYLSIIIPEFPFPYLGPPCPVFAAAGNPGPPPGPPPANHLY